MSDITEEANYLRSHGWELSTTGPGWRSVHRGVTTIASKPEALKIQRRRSRVQRPDPRDARIAALRAAIANALAGCLPDCQSATCVVLRDALAVDNATAGVPVKR